MPDFPVYILDGLGTVGLVVLFGIALARGWIVTAREHATVVHDRNEWRTESRIKDAEIAEKNDQLRHLAEVGRTVDAIMRSLQTTASDLRDKDQR